MYREYFNPFQTWNNNDNLIYDQYFTNLSQLIIVFCGLFSATLESIITTIYQKIWKSVKDACIFINVSLNLTKQNSENQISVFSHRCCVVFYSRTRKIKWKNNFGELVFTSCSIFSSWIKDVTIVILSFKCKRLCLAICLYR